MADFTLINDDVLKGIDELEDESIDLVLTSPPYNIGKEYERDRRLPLDEYIDWIGEVVSAITPKLKQTGSFVWQVGNHVQSGQIYPLDILTYPKFDELGYQLRNRIIWQFNFGLHAKKRLSGRYETLLWFTRSDEHTFNLEKVLVPQLILANESLRRKEVEFLEIQLEKTLVIFGSSTLKSCAAKAPYGNFQM